MVIHNVFHKLNEANERMYALEKIVKHKHLAKETFEETIPKPILSCNICDLIFKSESDLNKHTEVKHTDNVEKETEVESIAIRESDGLNI